MAKFKFTDALGYDWLEGKFDEESLSLDSSSKTELVYVDSGGASIVFSGSGFGTKGDAVSKGKVTGAEFLDGDGATLLTVTNASFKAGKLLDEFGDGLSFWDMMSRLTAGNDKYYGSDPGTDFNIGNDGGNDLIKAGEGGSSVRGSEGNDRIIGSDGWDTIDFNQSHWESDEGATFNVNKGWIKDPWGDKDRVSGLEEYRGTLFKDKFIGSDGDDFFVGFSGNDVFKGGKGTDEIRYFREERYDDGGNGIKVDLASKKIIDGFGDTDKVSGIERVIGTYFDDTFVGDDKDNQFRGLSGTDSFDGGEGTDGINFNFWQDIGQSGIKVDLTLASGQIIDDGFGNTETAISIEGIVGSSFDDSIRMGAADGWVDGYDGDDLLIAGTGEHWMHGGSGADIFQFNAIEDSKAGTDTRDFIDDFDKSEGDKIDLSGFGTVTFADISTSLTGDGSTMVTVANGLEFFMNGTVTLAETDFIL